MLYIPRFAQSIGHAGGIYLGLYSGSSIFGQIIVRMMSDYWDVTWLIAITSLTSAGSIFFLWGYCNGVTMLASFSITCKPIKSFLKSKFTKIKPFANLKLTSISFVLFFKKSKKKSIQMVSWLEVTLAFGNDLSN